MITTSDAWELFVWALFWVILIWALWGYLLDIQSWLKRNEYAREEPPRLSDDRESRQQRNAANGPRRGSGDAKQSAGSKP